MRKVIRVGTRESDLAVSQSKWVIGEIRRKHPCLDFELVPIRTRGDAILDKRLDKLGGKGLFVKELENALLDKTVDIAVHSMKDMPAEMPEGLVIAALSRREDPRDALVDSKGRRLFELPSNSVVGTSSLRREVQLLQKRSDLILKTLRGNVLTRIAKLQRGEYDAVVLAAAGLKRLGLAEYASEYFEAHEMVPAAGQGVLCVEGREGDDLSFLSDTVDCEESRLAVDAERAFLLALGGGCSTPIGAYAAVEGDVIRMYGMMASEDKKNVYRAFVEGSRRNAVELGKRLAEAIFKQTGTIGWV